jgi:hypothetical protein
MAKKVNRPVELRRLVLSSDNANDNEDDSKNNSRQKSQESVLPVRFVHRMATRLSVTSVSSNVSDVSGDAYLYQNISDGQR